MKTSEGKGIAEEQENIEVLEISLDEARQMLAYCEINDASPYC
jgi:hypothetical protein